MEISSSGKGEGK